MRNANLALTAVVILGGCAQYDVISPKEMVVHTDAMIEEHRALKRTLIRLHPYEEKIAAALIDDERVTKVRFALIVNSYDLGPRPDLVPYALLLVVNRELDEDAVVQMIQTAFESVGVRSHLRPDLVRDANTWATPYGTCLLSEDGNPDITRIENAE